MSWRRLVCLCLVMSLVGGAAWAQTSGARFIGDDGRASERADNVQKRDAADKALSRMAVGQNTKPNNPTVDTLANVQRTPPNQVRDDNRVDDIMYRKYNKTTGQYEVVNIGKMPTADQWVKFLNERKADPSFPDIDFDGRDDRTELPPGSVKKMPAMPPKNRLRVIDQGKLKELEDQGKKPPTVYRQVTKIERYMVAIPVYETRCVTAYPCCCTKCYSQLVRYDYEWRSRVIASYKEEAGADYPSTLVSVSRDVVVLAGNPQYTTEVPRLCEFHYGKGAKIDAPTVPLVATINDDEAKAQIGAVVEVEGNITTIKEGVAVSELLVPGSEKGLPVGDIGKNASSRDRGTITNLKDTALVQDNLVVAPNPLGKPSDPLDMTIRRPKQ